MANAEIPEGCTVKSDGSAVFAYRDASAGAVMVAGDFTGWSASPMPMPRAEGTGAWTVTTSALSAGVHAYKYIVDGRWIVDPANHLSVDDGFGGRNAAFVVGGRALGGPGAVRIASLNLHTYQEARPLEKLEQVAFGMAAMKADLLLLQEVGEHVSDPGRPNAGEVVRRHLESFTGRAWHHAWREAHIGFDVYREGLSILSSSPLSDVTAIQLSTKGLARIALLATTTLGGVTLRAGSTHISWERAAGDEEARRLIEAIDAAPTPGAAAVIVAGDFNAGPGGAPIKRFVANGYIDVGAAAGVTEATFLEGADGRIDYHFLCVAPGKPSPRVEAFARTFDGAPARLGYQPRVSDHAGLIGAYSWPR